MGVCFSCNVIIINFSLFYWLVCKKIGVDYPPSLLFVLCIIFLLFINFKNSRRIAELQMKVVELGQELAIVKEKVNRDEK